MKDVFEKIIERFIKVGNIQFARYTKPLITVEDAIEIVNQVAEEYVPEINVGENEEFCEWRNNGIADEWNPSCEKGTYNVFGVAWFKRCPYCGKKIKVVE